MLDHEPPEQHSLSSDRWTLQALATHSGKQQVVLLGAGLDARAWRMDLPDNVR